MSWNPFDSKNYGDTQDAYNKYAQQMRDRAGQTEQNYAPWIERGRQGMDTAYGEYQRNIDNPNSVQDQIAGGYYQSPYEKYLRDKTTEGINNNAANTGMLGSGAMNRALQEQLSGITGQFMNDYVNRGMNSYGVGLQGMGHLGDMGFQANQQMNDAVNNLYNQAAGGELQGARSASDARAKRMGGILGGIGGLAGGALGSIWGPVGGAIGKWAGDKVGGYLSPGSASVNVGAG